MMYSVYSVKNSKLVWNCHHSLVELAEHNRVELMWVPGHMGIDGNEIADHLAIESSSHSLIGPEPALVISANVALGVISDWTSRKHYKPWQSICGQGREGFFKKICI